MRLFLIAALGLLLGQGFVGQAQADPQSAMAAVREVQGVQQAQEDSSGNLWVMVQRQPNGNYDAAAAQICRMVIHHQARIFLVKMVDAQSVTHKSKPKEWVVMGAANCRMVQ